MKRVIYWVLAVIAIMLILNLLVGKNDKPVNQTQDFGPSTLKVENANDGYIKETKASPSANERDYNVQENNYNPQPQFMGR